MQSAKALAGVQPREHGALLRASRGVGVAVGPTPRTRGARLLVKVRRRKRGSNPANTGRSLVRSWWPILLRVQPREHGALPRDRGRRLLDPGPTPRTRGAPVDPLADAAPVGSNPANTGRSCGQAVRQRIPEVQPREHGALWTTLKSLSKVKGPTPRTRGALWRSALHGRRRGSNPANTGRSHVVKVAGVDGEVQPREHGALAAVAFVDDRCKGPTPRTRGAPRCRRS